MFCTKCQAEPYHLGSTCEDFERQQTALKCRFCGEEIVQQAETAAKASHAVRRAPSYPSRKSSKTSSRRRSASAAAASAAAREAHDEDEEEDGDDDDDTPSQHLCCASERCRSLLATACIATLPCGHPCGGVKGETQCLPCLVPECVAKRDIEAVAAAEPPAAAAASMSSSTSSAAAHAGASGVFVSEVDGNEFCNICWTDSLASAPCVQLGCGHIFHYECLCQRIKAGWPGAAISFSFLQCPLCQGSCAHPVLRKAMKQPLRLKAAVEAEAEAAVIREGMTKDAELVDAGGRFKGDKRAYGMHKFQFLMCSKCRNPYFAGRRDCAAAGAEAKVNATTLCSSCTPLLKGNEPCPRHGTRSLARKCRFCCSQAVWFCFGSTSFCEPCHSRHCKGEFMTRKKPEELPQCAGPSKCPLKVKHPPNGTGEFGLGCAECHATAEVQKAIKV